MAWIDKRPPWFDELHRQVEENWQHHGPCGRISLTSSYDEERKAWRLVASPVYQEVVGGGQDGAKVWTAFTFDASDLLGLFGVPGLLVREVRVRSLCVQCNPTPLLELTGRLHDEDFTMLVLLEPVPGSPVVEMIDTINQCVRER